MVYLDDEMRKSYKRSINTVVPWLLMASYLYYLRPEHVPILSDCTFDRACEWLYDNWEVVEHRHKHLITKEDLAAGSLYALKENEYPLITKNTAVQLSESIRTQPNIKV